MSNVNPFCCRCAKPSKDEYLICKRYQKAKGEEKSLLQNDYDAHITRKDKANDSKEAESDSTFVSATFDLQKVLQIPMPDAGPVYYSRKLCVYNLTVYEAELPNKGTVSDGMNGMEEGGAVKVAHAYSTGLTPCPIL